MHTKQISKQDQQSPFALHQSTDASQLIASMITKM